MNGRFQSCHRCHGQGTGTKAVAEFIQGLSYFVGYGTFGQAKGSGNGFVGGIVVILQDQQGPVIMI